MNRLKTLLSLGATALLLALGQPRAHAYTHPCIPNTLDELATIKTNLDKEPWKQGYAVLVADWHSQLDYTIRGPFAQVGRAPHINLGEWQNDMVAVYNLARMWYFTGNAAYAQKARDILIAWADTQTSFIGNESGLALGDFAVCYGGGASILRGTWPGWTATDTTKVKNYFLNVLWPAVGGPNSGASWHTLGPANKGAIYMEASMAIALFCDDTAKFNDVVTLFRTDPAGGLPNSLPTGQLGETGRDAGHAFGQLNGMAFVAELAWKQGVDLFSELDNRLLACGEYYARNTLVTDSPFVPLGTIDYHYFANVPGVGYGGNRLAYNILQNAYKNRKNLPTPWLDRKLEENLVDGGNWMFAKTADSTTASTQAPVSFPAVSPASSGLTLTTLGTQTAGRSVSYSSGVWTISGLGSGTWTDGTDDCQFAYKAMTGDCALVAKVTSVTFSGSQNGKAGLMIRDNLVGTIAKRAWTAVTPTSTGGYLFEAHMRGWAENWGGSNRAQRSQAFPNFPYWLKLERRGGLLTTYSSNDGTSWSPLLSSYYTDLPSTLYIGLFICSGNTTANTATFANLSFTGGTGGLVTTPAAPEALLASGSGKAISVRWLPSFGATAYDLLRSTTSGSGYTALASNLSATTTSYVDTSAAAGTTYYYVARAKNSAGTSGNSPQFGAALLPAPRVNLAFGGTSSASFNSGSGAEGSDQAFNQEPGSKWYGYNSPTGWLQYDFGANNAQVVKRYTVSSADVATRDPKSWTFLGSQDGSNWTTLNSQSNQSFAYRMQQNAYDIGNTTAYRFYRLNITANNGAGGTAISELGLWSDTGRTLPDGRYRVVSRKSRKVLDLVNGGTADGTDAVQWGWDGGNDQKWDLLHLGNGQYRLTGVASGKFLEVTGASTANGAVVQIWPSNGNNCQKWTLTPSGDGFFKLLNVNSGKAADVSAGSSADGAAIIQWDYSGADNQQWILAPLSITATTRLQSHNFPTRHVRHAGYRGRIDENVSPVEDSQFRLRPGLTNSAGVSFESVNFPGYFLRVRTNGEVWVDKNDGTTDFLDSATFERVPGLADASKSSFRMWTDSTRYLRHYAYLMVAQSGSGSAFNGDATFAEVSP